MSEGYSIPQKTNKCEIMDFNYLNEYSENEKERFNTFIKSTSIEKLQNTEYPPKNRFIKLHDFFTYATIGINESIWTQTPFTGSLLVPLIPLRNFREFEQIYNISKNQIPEVIDFIKETGKIQFYIEGSPLDYLEIDYLDPIFSELNPPVLFSVEPYLKNDIINESKIEFNTIIKCVDFNEYVKRELIDISPMMKKELLSHFLKSFIRLRLYKFDKIADSFVDNVMINPTNAFSLLRLSNQILTEPLSKPLQGSHNFSTAEIRDFKQTLNGLNIEDLKKFQYPCEIGTFLSSKMVNYSDSFSACKSIVFNYREQDLKNVLNAVSDGIVERRPDVVIDNIKILNELLDDIWQESQLIKSQKKILKGEFAVSFGLLGVFLNNQVGLMATLGLMTLSSTSNYLDELTELISKRCVKSNLSTIYDFKEKYRL